MDWVVCRVWLIGQVGGVEQENEFVVSGGIELGEGQGWVGFFQDFVVVVDFDNQQVFWIQVFFCFVQDDVGEVEVIFVGVECYFWFMQIFWWQCGD